MITEEIVKISSGMWTDEPLLCIIIFVLAGALLQLIVSSVVLARRKGVLKEEYGYSDEQINLFYWKSIILFPITWVLLLAQGWKGFWRKVLRR